MTVNQTTGAVSNVELNWHSIDWNRAESHVRRLQARIVKATQQERWNKVKTLQRLLTRSFSAKAIAVKRVTTNSGKKTPGVDGEIWDTPEQKAEAIQRLQHRGYQPQPLRRSYIDKANGKKRPLGIPTMLDRAMQALHLLALDPVAETLADPSSYGFRKERSATDAITHCALILAKRDSAQWILEGDIKSCFDQISHDWLLANIPLDKSILEKWLKAGYMEQGTFFDTKDGTPQGGIISPVLANMALDGLQALLQQHFPTNQKKTPRPKVNLIRYADDFVITGSSKELLETQVKPLVEHFLSERGLELSQEKTCITHIDEGFDFLGQTIRKYDGKLLTKPSKKSIKKLMDKITQVLRTNRQAPAGLLITRLNPIIRGWAMYHRHGTSKQTFSKIDAKIFNLLWRWIKRRHPNKGKRWMKAKYFKTVKNRNWVFFGELSGTEHQLYFMSQVTVKRHVKIKGDANPYDPEWEMYFEKRIAMSMLNSLYGRNQLIRLWKAQEGICPICKQKITRETGWHNHHITPRVKGGQNKYANRVLLHPECHIQVHCLNITVEKPRPAKGVKKA